MGKDIMGQLLRFARFGFFLFILCVAGIAESYARDSMLDSAPEEDGGGLFKWIIEANLRRDCSFSYSPDLIGVPGLNLRDFRIMENKNFLSEHPYLQPYAMGADLVSAHVNPLALFLGRISLTSLEVVNPEVQFAVDDRLRTNFDDILANQKSNRFINWVRVAKFNVEDARVHIYTDIIFSKYQEFFLTDIDVKMNNIIRGKTANVDIKAISPGATTQNAFCNGTVGPIVSLGEIEKSPMDLKLSVVDAPVQIKDLIQIPKEIEDSERLKKIIGLPEDGMANVEATITGDYDKGIVGNGLMKMTDVYLANLDDTAKGEKFNAEVRAKGTASILRETVDFEDVTVSVEENVVTMHGTMDKLLGNTGANLKVKSDGINLLTVQKIYPFYELVSGMEPAGGMVSGEMDLGGNLETGFTAEGKVYGKDIQIYDKTLNKKGIPLSGSLVITEKPVYHVRDSLLEINQVDMQIGSSHVVAKGKVVELLGDNRNLQATASSERMNIPEMMEFVPLIKSMAPEGSNVCGFMGFKCDVESNGMKTAVSGEVDLKESAMALEDFAEKRKGTKCTVNFKTNLELDQVVGGEATVAVEDGIIHDPTLFQNALSYLMGNASKSSQGGKIISKVTDRRIFFKDATVKGEYLGGSKFKGEILVTGLNPLMTHDMTIRLTGTLDLEGYKIDGQGSIEMAPGISKDILSVAKQARKYVKPMSDGSADVIVLPFSTNGSLTSPKYKFGASEGKQIAMKQP